MENDKTTINEELDHIRNSINQKNETQNTKDNFILLDKIVSKGKKHDNKTQTEIKPSNKDIEKKNKNIKSNTKLSNPKKNIVDNISKPFNKKKDPVEALVDREIKPIIKKWINKNLKSFVKTIVIEEMKLISKATRKHK